jgi:hypothetical protein
MTVNINLLDQVVGFLEKNPKAWFQSEWIRQANLLPVKIEGLEDFENCGTTGCVAGWTVAIADPAFAKTHSDDDIAQRAEELLGLNAADASAIFNYTHEYDPVSGERRVSWEEMKEKIATVLDIDLAV